MTEIKIISTSKKKGTYQVIVKIGRVSRTHHVPISVYKDFEAFINKHNNK